MPSLKKPSKKNSKKKKDTHIMPDGTVMAGKTHKAMPKKKTISMSKKKTSNKNNTKKVKYSYG